MSIIKEERNNQQKLLCGSEIIIVRETVQLARIRLRILSVKEVTFTFMNKIK